MTKAETAPRHGRKPVWKEVEEQQSRRLSARARQANKRRRQVAVVYDIDGPKVRLGVAWFVLVCGALFLGRIALAVLYATVAALAAAQVVRAWRRRREAPNIAVAAAGAAALALAAAVSTAVLGAALLGLVVASVVVSGSTRHPLRNAARTVQSAVWVGGAAAAVIVTHRYEPSAALALVLVVSAYEIGDFLVGSGARNAIEGPVAGAAAALVIQFGVSTIGFEPFEASNGFGFAVLAAVLCPLGQLAGSLVLPSVKAKANALRRLDSLLLLGPMWAWLVGLAVVPG
ncbi:MAG: hypothetical protein H0W25_09750 [Acidimicrobiia bacterium]|nr:hypothetical protein [Acidimicrobiia bacterium]